MSAGEQHGCGIATGGSAYCWGYNGNGQLGDSSTTSRVTPTAVLSASPILQIAPGDSHTCGLTATGGVCWGGSFFLNGFTGLSLDVIASGWSHECGLTAAGSAYCWGDNYNGQLGNDVHIDSPLPLPVQGGLSFTTVVTGSGGSCGLTANGDAWCWPESFNNPAPALVPGGIQFTSLSVGGTQVCGVATGGAGYCWGANNYGQLGNGSILNYGQLQRTPVEVIGGLSFSNISAGAEHTCGITVQNVVYCWGQNFAGQLGASGFAPAGGVPFPVKVRGQP